MRPPFIATLPAFGPAAALALVMALALTFAGCPDDPTTMDPPDGVDAADGLDTDTDTAELPPADPCEGVPEGLIPGPCQDGFDAALEAKAHSYERQFHAFSAWALGVNTDIEVAVDQDAARAAVTDWVTNGEGWDFEAWSGLATTDIVTAHHKVAGLYAGVGIMADIYRYAVLRDQKYPQADVDAARDFALKGLEALRMAVVITGTPGVIARGLARTDLPGSGASTTMPLFDDKGAPLPEVKSNGTWRTDQSGAYPGVIWEDSISRDQLVGWVGAMGAAKEVFEGDITIPASVLETLAIDAKALGEVLQVVRSSGYDLEIPDADGRTTLHGYLSEFSVDGPFYVPTPANGFHAMMALGIVATYAAVSGDAELERWLHEDLIEDRRLHEISRDSLLGVDLGYGTNYSGVNMAFMGMWLAQRHLTHVEGRAALEEALKDALYGLPGTTRKPRDTKQSLFDFIYAAGVGRCSATQGMDRDLVDFDALARGLETLGDYPDAPYWNLGTPNCPDAVCDCDDKSVDTDQCTGLDGATNLTVLGCVGRKCSLIAKELVPMAIRGPSNYHWRSNPYMPNLGGDGTGNVLLPAVDFRIAYWLGRYASFAP